jgi:hypothetical protein
MKEFANILNSKSEKNLPENFLDVLKFTYIDISHNNIINT